MRVWENLKVLYLNKPSSAGLWFKLTLKFSQTPFVFASSILLCAVQYTGSSGMYLRLV